MIIRSDRNSLWLTSGRLWATPFCFQLTFFHMIVTFMALVLHGVQRSMFSTVNQTVMDKFFKSCHSFFAVITSDEGRLCIYLRCSCTCGYILYWEYVKKGSAIQERWIHLSILKFFNQFSIPFFIYPFICPHISWYITTFVHQFVVQSTIGFKYFSAHSSFVHLPSSSSI